MIRASSVGDPLEPNSCPPPKQKALLQQLETGCCFLGLGWSPVDGGALISSAGYRSCCTSALRASRPSSSATQLSKTRRCCLDARGQSFLKKRLLLGCSVEHYPPPPSCRLDDRALCNFLVLCGAQGSKSETLNLNLFVLVIYTMLKLNFALVCPGFA